MLKKLSIAAMLAMAIGIVPMAGHAVPGDNGCVSAANDSCTFTIAAGNEDAAGVIVATDAQVTITHLDGNNVVVVDFDQTGLAGNAAQPSLDAGVEYTLTVGAGYGGAAAGSPL